MADYMTKSSQTPVSGWSHNPGWGMAIFVVAAITLWRIVELIAAPINLSFDEAQYWSWSLTPEFGYFSKPPVVSWVIGLTTAVFGHEEWAVRMGSALAHGGTALALFSLGRSLYSPRVGLYSAVAFATLPGVSLSSYLISTDPFLMCAWGWGLVVLHKALCAEERGEPSLKLWLGLGVIFGVGMLAKYAMIAFIASMAFAMGFVKEWRGYWKRPGPWLALAVGAVVFAPNVMWNAAHHFVSFAHTKANANLQDSGFHPGKALEFFGGQFAVFGPVMFATLILLVVKLKGTLATSQDDERKTLVFLASFALPLIVVMTVQGFISRANANWAAPAYVAGSVWVVPALMKRELWLRLSIGLHIVLALVIVNFDDITERAGIELSKKTDPMKRLRGWDRAARALENLIVQLPQNDGPIVLVFDERKVLTPMLYYMPERLKNGMERPQFAKWNPDGHIDDHYELTADLKNYVGRTAYFVTRWPDPNMYAQAFAGPVETAIKITIPIHKDYALKLNVIPVGKFVGYSRQD